MAKTLQKLLKMTTLLQKRCKKFESLPHIRIKESPVEHVASVPAFVSTTAEEMFNKQGSEQRS
jgi:predicted nucleic acid-binding protein